MARMVVTETHPAPLMTYELAKQLKDAGFPQDGLYMYGQGYNFVVNPNTPGSHSLSAAEYERQLDKCYLPTLSELIEACPKERGDFEATFTLTIFDKTRWVAFYDSGDGASFYEQGEGSSSEEAVAKLWLALHT
jgi:hypothetical protein